MLYMIFAENSVDLSREATSSLASRDEETAQRLWELSEALTGHRY